MKNLPLTAFFAWLLLGPSTTSSQSIQWVKQINAKGYALEADGNGNFYLTGSFEGTAAFDDVIVTSKGQTDIFTSRYSADGKLIWLRSAGAESYDEGFSLVLSRHDICVTGFTDNANFGDTALAGYPFFIADYDSSGRLNWVRSLTSYGGSASSVAADGSGNLYLTGSSHGLLLPDSLGISESSFFIIKFNNAGAMLWARGTQHTLNSAAVQPAQAGITCDIHDNIYVAGAIQSEEIRFDSTHVLTPEGIENVFVVKYDSCGNVVLAIQTSGTGDAYPLSIAVDTASNIYLTGCFEGSATFGDTTLVSFGSFDIFTAKYDASGELVWVRQAGSTQYDSGRSVTVDAAGNVYGIGINSLSATFSGYVLDRGGAFLAKYDAAGNTVSVTHIFSVHENVLVSGNNFTVNDLSLTAHEDILVTGFFNETVYFDSVQMSGLGGSKGFVAKLKHSPTRIEDDTPRQPLMPMLNQNYPNPFNPSTTIRYALPHRSHVTLTVFNPIGQKVTELVKGDIGAGYHSVEFNASNLASGVYFYRLQAGEFTQVRKLCLVR